MLLTTLAPIHTRTGTELFDTAIETGVRLVGQFNGGILADAWTTDSLFAEWKAAIARLAPDDGYRINGTAACEAAFLDADCMTARWQMIQLVRRLRNQRRSWIGTVEPKGRKLRCAS